MAVNQPDAVPAAPYSNARKRRKLYIKDDIQVRYALVFVLITTLGGIIGYVFPRLRGLLESTSAPFQLVAIILMAFIACGIVYLSLFFTHKIAGPVYRLCSFLEEAFREKSIAHRVSFRQNDELHEVAASLNQLLDDLREELNRATVSLEGALAKLDGLVEGAAGQEGKAADELVAQLKETRELMAASRIAYQTE